MQVARILFHGTFWQTNHVARERRNITVDDIQAMLMGASKLKSKPEWNEEHRNWKYTLLGTDIDGDELTLVIALNVEEQTLAVIPKF